MCDDQKRWRVTQFRLVQACPCRVPAAVAQAGQVAHKQLHKRVYADVGAGQFSRVGMPKPVNEGTCDGLRFGASTLEGPLDS